MSRTPVKRRRRTPAEIVHAERLKTSGLLLRLAERALRDARLGGDVTVALRVFAALWGAAAAVEQGHTQPSHKGTP